MMQYDSVTEHTLEGGYLEVKVGNRYRPWTAEMEL
jgi:hypothetical protein